MECFRNASSALQNVINGYQQQYVSSISDMQKQIDYFSTYITDREKQKCLDYINKIGKRTEAFEDILWALINSTEFQTKR